MSVLAHGNLDHHLYSLSPSVHYMSAVKATCIATIALIVKEIDYLYKEIFGKYGQFDFVLVM